MKSNAERKTGCACIQSATCGTSVRPELDGEVILNSLLFRFLQLYLNTLGLYVSKSCERMFVELISHFTHHSFFSPCSFYPRLCSQ